MTQPVPADPQVLARVAGHRPLLEAISREIHANPELSFQEYRASQLLAGTLEGMGWEVERGVAGLDTAFVATAPGSRPGGPTIGILAEYDALPGVGHACGHNLIATVALGAGLAAAPVLGEAPGTIKVFGTPAEEGGVGKGIMLAGGVFEGTDAVLAFHATSGVTQVSTSAWAAALLHVRYTGRAAHAAAAPWDGINALDAMISLFSAIGLARQQLLPDSRLHGIITNGGQAFNVIPERTEAVLCARSRHTPTMYRLLEQLEDMARAAAALTGCQVELERGDTIEGIRWVPVLGRLVEAAADALGLDHGPPGPFCASTDFGNVSQVIPGIQLELGLFPPEHPLHSHGVTALAATDQAHDGMVQAAQVLGSVAARLLRDPSLVEAAAAEFRAGA